MSSATLSSKNLPFLRQRMWLVLRARELNAYLADWAKPPNSDARNVLIYAQGRSGTTLLESLLCSTGHFTGLGEPLHGHTREVWAPIRYLRGLGRSAQGNVVAHVKGSQLVRERRRPVAPAQFLEALHSEGWTIIYVLRRHVAEQVLSECLARARGAYHKTDDRPEDTRLRIEPAEFLERYDRRLRFMAEDRAALDGVPHLSLTYEDDLRDPARHQATADQICAALGLPARPVRTDLRRIGGSDPRNRLDNYDEIETALAARRIAWDDCLASTSSPVSKRDRKA